MNKQPQIMEKERLGAFIDAVLAIVMTILVLELEKPKTFDAQGLWELRTNSRLRHLFLLARSYVGQYSRCLPPYSKNQSKNGLGYHCYAFFLFPLSLCDTAHSDSFYEWDYAGLLRSHRPTDYFFSLMVLSYA